MVANCEGKGSRVLQGGSLMMYYTMPCTLWAGRICEAAANCSVCRMDGNIINIVELLGKDKEMSKVAIQKKSKTIAQSR